jgi:NADPH2:quinone reductase
MRAAWYSELGPAADVLSVAEIATPEPAKGEVLVRVHASGINPSDTKKRGGWLGGTLDFDRVIPHSAGAGVITAIGDGVDATRIGERVWIYNAQFGRANGTAAKYVALPGELAVTLPATTSFAAGACLGVPACTAHNALFWSGPITGMSVLVAGGAGAVGAYAIQLAKSAGTRVLTTVSSAEKAAFAHELGADTVIDYTSTDVATAVLEATDEAGVERIVEVDFGSNVEINAKCISTKGAIGSYSSTRQPRFEFDYYGFGYKGARINFVQVYMLSPDERAHEVRDLADLMTYDKLVHPIAESFPLDRIADAHTAQEQPGRIGNIVLELQQSTHSIGDFMSDQILIWGGGAIGGTIAAYWKRAGLDVLLVDIVEEHVEACRTDGLNELEIARQLGDERVMGAFVNFGADWHGPGEIMFGNRGAVVVGEIDGVVRDRTRAMYDLLQKFEPDAVLTENICGYLWGKLGYGAMLFATATNNDTMAENFADPGRFKVWQALGAEVMAATLARDIKPIGFNGYERACFAPDADADLVRKSVADLAEFNSHSAKTHSGIWRDLSVRKRRTEIDAKIAIIADLAAEAGVKTPVIRRLVELIHDIEQGRREQSMDTFNELLKVCP